MVAQISLEELLDEKFIDTFVKNGDFMKYSVYHRKTFVPKSPIIALSPSWERLIGTKFFIILKL
jgi:hypothetical protein